MNSLLVLWLSWDDVKLRPLFMLLLSWDDVKLRPLWQWFYFVFVFVFIPHPAEYGAEESSPDAVPMLGLVRIGFGREGYLGGGM